MGKKLTQEQVLNQFKNIHGFKYNYSLVKYKNDYTKVKIICSEHGIFEMIPNAHKILKQGCRKCANKKNSDRSRLTNNEIIKRIEKIFGKGAFDFSLLDYKNAHKKITLICKKCNSKETKTVRCFYKGSGCSKCVINPLKYTTKQIIKLSKKKHGKTYDYSLVNYVNNHTPINIICKTHGVFNQIPQTHYLDGSGCPRCKNSKGEEIIAIWLNKNKIKYTFQYRFTINNSYHYFDFYLHDYNTIIEFNGLQHYAPIKWFGGKKRFDITKKRDYIKKMYCENNNIKLLVISHKNLSKIDKILTNKIWDGNQQLISQESKQLL